MRTLNYLIMAVTLLSAGAVAAKEAPVDARGEARLAKRLAGRTAGKPVDCINLSDILDSEVIDNTAIVYRLPGNILYVNRPEFGRNSLSSNDIVVSKTFTSQLCRIDTIQMVDRTTRFPRGPVGLGKFVPYAKPKTN
jgi:hypothetical protein